MVGSAGQILTAQGVPPSPAQQGLANWNKGQGIVEAGGEFQGGPSMSTNVTQRFGGAGFGGAQTAGEESIANTQALTNFANQQAAQLGGGLGNILGKLGNLGGGGGSSTGGISSLPPG